MAFSVPLSGAAIEVLRCLFFHGPTFDGDVPSKGGRDELYTLGLCARHEGYQWLTKAGVVMALENGVDRDKERWQRERAQFIATARSQSVPADVVLVTQ